MQAYYVDINLINVHIICSGEFWLTIRFAVHKRFKCLLPHSLLIFFIFFCRLFGKKRNEKLRLRSLKESEQRAALEWSKAKHLSLVRWISLIFLLSLRVCLTVQQNNNMMGGVKKGNNWKKNVFLCSSEMLYFMSNIIWSVKLHYDKKKRVHKEYGSYYSDHTELYRKKYI